MTSQSPMTDAASRFIAGALQRDYPADVIDLAKMCLADWYGVALGARGQQAGESVRRLVQSWAAPGRARVLFDGTAPAAMAALVSGTYAHCLDYDDVHFPSLAHLSAPTWAVAVALGEETGATEREMLAAFITGFEIGARLGSNGVGEACNGRGWHSTGVVGRLSAAAAAAVLLRHDEMLAAHTLAIAATQTSGLVASFGTDGKPFHAGRAAFDGIVSAQLAANGFRGARDMLDRELGLARALIQDQSVRMRLDGLGEHWELRRNALKPYACCGFTHAPVDAARMLAAQMASGALRRARVQVHPLAPKMAGQYPHSPLAAKFSIAYCVALGLRGHRATEQDFHPERLADTAVMELVDKVEIVPEPSLGYAAAKLEVTLADGKSATADVPVSLGNPENPMAWSDLQGKFASLVQPVLGARTDALFGALRDFDRPGRFREAAAIAAEAKPAA